MKKTTFIILLITMLSLTVFSQKDVNGVVIADTSNFKLIKVWGTHYERGYAVGYLDGDRMLNLYNNYIVPNLSQAGIDTLKKYIEEEKHFVIAQKYHDEAQGMVDGINDAGFGAKDFDYLDVLAANTFFDFIGFSGKQENDIDFGCSSLMSWGDATSSTGLDGGSVISRHVDWTPNVHLINSSTVIAHIPEESEEQAWVMIGFAGQMSALSGVNNSGTAVFQNSLADFSGTALKNKAYEPIWFTARNALEVYDYNSDGLNNTNDVRDAVDINKNGYANGIILSVAAATNSEYDSLTAMVVESACLEPFHTYRYNNYDDLIPGDNLYAANASIKRNDAHNYEPRYDSIVKYIGDGTLIDDETNWSLMRDYSNSGPYNIQFMQFIPEDKILKLSVADLYKEYAYQKEPVVILIDTLFEIPAVNINKVLKKKDVKIFPNPVNQNCILNVILPESKSCKIQIYNSLGKQVYQYVSYPEANTCKIPVRFKSGIYFLEIEQEGTIYNSKLVVM
ncbi:MAG: T9SS type A sorting domain-containing protein [Bacteroidales bacterium]|nr:T9SS type A sorting domain-containing protein [Bacteroidales bacterium]